MPNTLGDSFSGDRLLLVGGGKMGTALLQGWLDAGMDKSQFGVQEPTPSETLVATGVALNPSQDFAPQIAVLAIKPQLADDVLPKLSLPKGCLVISLMAGVPTARMADLLGGGVACVRTMPNTPAAIGRGMTALFAEASVTDAQRDKASKLMAAVGATAWLDNEKLIDAATAISGSGPAYIFHLAEAMSSSAQALGLDEATARTLAVQTIIGAAAMLQGDDTDAGQLRRNVTSPGGTTEAALDVLMGEGGLGEMMRRATQAAAERAHELAQPTPQSGDAQAD